MKMGGKRVGIKTTRETSVRASKMFENLMTVKEVAALLRVSPQTLYKMLEQRSIPAVKVGSQWRFDREQIRDWIRKQSGSGSMEAPTGSSNND
jgi:excisionase family DNA binding protein